MEQFRVQGTFLISQVVNFAMPSVHAATAEEVQALVGDFEAEYAVLRGRYDALEAGSVEIESRNPEVQLLTANNSTYCHTLENNLSFNSCPAGKKCALIRRMTSRRSESGFACGVILPDTNRSFNFIFTIDQDQAFAGSESLEVVMVDGDNRFDKERFQIVKAEISDFRSSILGIEQGLETIGTLLMANDPDEALDRLNDLETEINNARTNIDDLETEINHHAQARLSVLFGAMVSKSRVRTSIEVNEAEMFNYNNFDRNPEVSEIHNDPWMNALQSYLTFDRLVTAGEWGLEQGFFGEPGSWDYDNFLLFLNKDAKADLTDYDAGKGWAFLLLEKFSPKRSYQFYKELHESDDDIPPKKVYYENILAQIAIEKATGAQAPVIPVDVMLAGINSFDDNNDYELLIKFMRLSVYLKHAQDMGFEMGALQGLTDKLDSSRDSAFTLLTQIKESTYQQKFCNYESQDLCVEAFKEELALSIGSNYFHDYFSIPDPFLFASDELRAFYGAN